MGVVCVLSYAIGESKGGQQTIDAIQKKLELVGAEKAGTFIVDCEMYQSQQPAPPRTLHTLHNSDQPASCFAFLDNGTNVVADLMFDSLITKMKGFYVPRKNLKAESRGQRFTLGPGGDLIVRIGSVILGQATTFKGVLVEVEYLPCNIPSEVWTLMKEFIVSILGSTNVNLDTPSQHFRASLDSCLPQGPADCCAQYLEHFNNFRKTFTSQSQPQR